MSSTLTIGIAGAGGDGVVVLGSFLLRLAAAQGYYSQMPRYYGAQIRGGGSAVKLSLDGESLPLPEDTLDILVCFSWEKYLELQHELALRPDTLVIHEYEPLPQIELPERSFRAIFSKLSQEATGAAQNKNIVALGLLTRILGLSPSRIREVTERDGELKLLSQKLPALEAGERLLAELSIPELRLAPPKDASPRVILHGNAAVARGALRAGCTAFFGYPITPAAEIMQTMHRELEGHGGVYLQSEDEIASAGLVIGASLTGVKAMTSTSGPGLDLMTESMGLASAAEIPMVVVDVQRCGPSTGIPSKSEQSDLNHAVHGGHGDAPRVVLAPYDVEGCYRLAIEAFNIAEHFQTPVILLSDQWLGQTFVAVDDGFLRADYPVVERRRPGGEQLEDYRRYRATEDFISPMSSAGDAGLTYRTTGLTHNEKGAPAFDFEAHLRDHEKRWRKLAPLRQRDDLVRVFGNRESTRAIVTWGSSALFVLETIGSLGLQDELKVCVPELLCPLPRAMEELVSACEKLLVVEMNYSGQLLHYLRSEIDLPRATELYARPGGRPFSKMELAGPIGELVG